MGSLSFGNTLASLRPARGLAPQRWLPARVWLALAAFCLAELTLVGYLRTSSALAHLHAAQLTPASSGAAAAVCTEADAAVADLWLVIPVLNVGRAIPSTTAHAWGQLPRLIDAVHVACAGIQAYANVAPWYERSLEQGAAVDLLWDVRAQRSQLATAGNQLMQAWSIMDSLDVDALAAESRLARVARLVNVARSQQADLTDALALAAPDRVETLLGGLGPRALVLRIADGGTGAQAYALLQEGRVVGVDVGAPPAPAAAVIWVDHAGLATLLETLGDVRVPELGGRITADSVQANPQLASAALARGMLRTLTRMAVGDYVRVVVAVKHSAEQQHAWLSFEDPALQALAGRRGWLRQ